MNYVAPQSGLTAFNCARCGAFAQQKFGLAHGQNNEGMRATIFAAHDLELSQCAHCGGTSVWVDFQLVYPRKSTIPEPSPDLPPDVASDYKEARAIFSQSSRGAAALLRLALQKLCRFAGEKGDNIDQDIASLVKKGLAPSLQQAMDTLRVVGNESVHPGVIDVRDDPELARGLFGLVNLLADRLIGEPRRIAELYQKLPQPKIDGIERRDGRLPRSS